MALVMTSKLLFSEIAELRNEKVHPSAVPDSRYVGLEHIEQNSLSLSGWGTSDDVDSQKQRFYKGDILFGKLRPYFRKVVIAPFDGICSTDIWVVRPIIETDRNFVFYWMASENFINSATNAAEGTRMPRAKWDWVSEFELPFMSAVNRQRVGGTLRFLDEKISINTAIAKTLEGITQAIFKSWFIDFDPAKAKMAGEKPVGMDDVITGLFPDSMEASELGLIPKGWKVQSLSDIGEFRNGLAMQKFPVVDEDYVLPVIKIAQLRAGNTNGADLASGLIDPKFVISDGDILFSWSGTLEIEHWAGGQGALNQHLFKVLGKSVPNWFAYFGSKIHLPEFRRIASGKATTMGHIQRKHLEEAKVSVPPVELMNSIDECFKNLVTEKVARVVQNRALGELRDALLPRLISGELQIPEEMLES